MKARPPCSSSLCMRAEETLHIQTVSDHDHKPPRLRANKRMRSVHWWLAWLIALLLAGLVVGVSVATTDPDWDGTEPENISNSPLNLAWQPAIASGPSERIVVAWSDQWSDEGRRDVYTVFSADNGHTWSTPEVVSGTADKSLLPDALVVGDQVFVAWVDGDPPIAIYEAEIGTEGARRIPSPLPLSNTQPRLAAGTDRLHVVFNAGQNIPNILYATRPLTAMVWPTATIIYTHTATYGSWYPVLVIGPEGGTLHVVWEERASATERAIMYMRGKVNGAGVDWEPALSLSAGITLSVWPAIAADSGGNVHVVWGEQVGEGTLDQREQYVRYARYDVASGSWISPAVRIDPEPVKVNRLNPTDIAPRLALVERDNQVTVCVAWHGFRGGEFAEEVLLSCSRDGGQFWSLPQNVSRSPGAEAISIAPSITFDASGQLHGVWQEHTGGSPIYNYQIYYARTLNQVFLPLVARNWK